MRIVIFVGLLLCLVSTSRGNTLDSLQALRIEVLRQLLVNDTGNAILTTTRVDGFVNRACRQVVKDFPATPALDTVTMNSLSEVGALNTDFLRIRSVARMQDSAFRVPLIHIPRDSLRLLLLKAADNEDKPQDLETPKYYSTNGTNLLLAPKLRDSSITFLVEYYVKATDLVDSSTTTNIIYAYREEIVVYACKLAARAQSNYPAAEVFRQDYLELVGLAKDDK
jgi:hypothetical protein